MWEVVMKPATGADVLRGTQGVLVFVSNGRITSLIGRVAYDRSVTQHPFRSFKRALQIVIARAEAEADNLNKGAR